MSVVVLVPGNSGLVQGVVDRWRMNVAVNTLSAHGGGRLVVSGYQGEAERLAALAPLDVEVALEPGAVSTWENVERSIPLFVGADQVAIATDLFHRRRALRYLRSLAPEVAEVVIEPAYTWRQGWWMDFCGAAYEGVAGLRRVIARRQT